MNKYEQISSELDPYFRYANRGNRSIIDHQWKGAYGSVRIHRIYKNCVSCNTTRFSDFAMPYLPLGTNTYFCDSCHQKVAKVVKKYETGNHSKENEIFNNVWNDKLFG